MAKISEVYFDDVFKQFKDFDEGIRKNFENTMDMIDASKKLIEVTNQIATSNKSMTDKRKELNKAETESMKITKQLNDLDDDVVKGKLRLQKANADQRKELKLLIDLETKQVGTMGHLLAENRKLRKAKEDIVITDRKGRRAVAKINQTIDKNTKILKRNSDAYVKTKMNIGNYKSAITGLTGALGIGLGAAGLVAGFSKILTSSAELDDNLANVRKTTGLTNTEVRKLFDTLTKFDTRTSMAGLLGIAEAAGRMNVAGSDLAAFVEVVDKSFVALGDTLKGSASDIATQLSKISNQFGLEDEFGVSEGINRFGSVLNDLGAKTKATEGPILDFTNRLVGLSRVFQLNITDITALGALFDETGQEVSVSGTAISQVLLKMGQETVTFANIAGMSVKDFEDLFKRDAVGALIAVSKGVNDTARDNLKLAQTFDDMQLQGKKVVGTLGTLAKNTERFTELQLLSNAALESGTSLTDEFNIKNNTLAASIDKLSKNWEVLLTASGDGTNAIKASVDFFNDTILKFANLDLIFTRSTQLTVLQISRTYDLLLQLQEEKGKQFSIFVSNLEKHNTAFLKENEETSLKILSNIGFTADESIMLLTEFYTRRAEAERVDANARIERLKNLGKEILEQERLIELERLEQAEALRQERLLQNALEEQEDDLDIEPWMMEPLESQKESQDKSLMSFEDYIFRLTRFNADRFIWLKEQNKEVADDEIKNRERVLQQTKFLAKEGFDSILRIGDISRNKELISLEKQLDSQAITQEAYEQKVAEVKLRQAKADKARALFNIAIQTFENINESFGNPGLVIAAAALGATSAALVLAEPLPEYYKGTKDSKEGPAWVGEEGWELMINKKGQTFISPDRPTLMDLEGGMEIIPHEESKKLIDATYQFQSQDNGPLQKEIRNGNKAIVRAMNRRHNDEVARKISDQKGFGGYMKKFA
jgi:TP901 family phage tail tape measure protein